jgi:hypothetical protein
MHFLCSSFRVISSNRCCSWNHYDSRHGKSWLSKRFCSRSFM